MVLLSSDRFRKARRGYFFTSTVWWMSGAYKRLGNKWARAWERGLTLLSRKDLPLAWIARELLGEQSLDAKASNPALCPLRLLEVRAELGHLSPNLLFFPDQKKNPFHPG